MDHEKIATTIPFVGPKCIQAHLKQWRPAQEHTSTAKAEAETEPSRAREYTPELKRLVVESLILQRLCFLISLRLLICQVVAL